MIYIFPFCKSTHLVHLLQAEEYLYLCIHYIYSGYYYFLEICVFFIIYIYLRKPYIIYMNMFGTKKNAFANKEDRK